MTDILMCPECGEKLEMISSRCVCGWQDTKTAVVSRYYCAYTFQGERCSLPGTRSARLYGSPQWFCEEHVHHHQLSHFNDKAFKNMKTFSKKNKETKTFRTMKWVQGNIKNEVDEDR